MMPRIGRCLLHASGHWIFCLSVYFDSTSWLLSGTILIYRRSATSWLCSQVAWAQTTAHTFQDLPAASLECFQLARSQPIASCFSTFFKSSKNIENYFQDLKIFLKINKLPFQKTKLNFYMCTLESNMICSLYFLPIFITKSKRGY